MMAIESAGSTVAEASGECERSIQDAQALRMKRFTMSFVTFVIALLSMLLITCIGLGNLTSTQWVIFVSVGVLGIGFFFALFHTNANLRFKEPSLTREQIVFWSFWGLFAMYWLPGLRPVVLLFYLPPFSFGILALTHRQYLGVVAAVMTLYGSLLVVEYFQHPQGFNVQYQLFLFALFGILLTWFAFFGGFVSSMRRRLRGQIQETARAHEAAQLELEKRTRIQAEKEALIGELQEVLGKVKTLSGFLPICASCKKIRDDKGYWNQIESYIMAHSNAEFSHGICPDCVRHLYPEVDLSGMNKKTD